MLVVVVVAVVVVVEEEEEALPVMRGISRGMAFSREEEPPPPVTILQGIPSQRRVASAIDAGGVD